MTVYERWEHKLVIATEAGRVFSVDYKSEYGDLLELLTKLGNQRWEVATEVFYVNSDGKLMFKYTLKRKTLP
jgi:hypothetical protein